jgi:hypothetical protein
MSRIYKIIKSSVGRTILGIFFLISGFILICMVAERIEMVSSLPSVWKKEFSALRHVFSSFLWGMYLVCTRNRYKTGDTQK